LQQITRDKEFDDTHVQSMRNDPRAWRGFEELKRLGNKIIEEHFPKKGQYFLDMNDDRILQNQEVRVLR